MKHKVFSMLIMGTGMVASFALDAASVNDATPAPDRSQMQTHLRMEVKDDTKAIHFINTNNDPDIFTKVYVLKHADPYELRPYVKSAVRSERVAGDATKVEAIKYEDGTGMLIVSAEDYRFDKQNIGMSIDEIIESLDMPKVSSSSGSIYYFYFPKYWDSTSLAAVMRNSGLENANSEFELQGGKDVVTIDTGLNAMLFYTPKYSIKNIERMLKLYDTPTSEANIKYTIYELNYENDGTLGVDFQAWKNGPGADLFSVGSRWTNGWDAANMAVVSRSYIRNSYTKFISFNPKWNTKYLDFLVARSKAKIITSGELSVMTNTDAYIENTTRLANIEDGAAFDSKANIMAGYQRLEDVNWDNGTGAVVGNNGRYRLNGAIDEKGRPLSIFRSDGTTAVGAVMDFMISKSIVGNETYYYVKIDSNVDAYLFNSEGENVGKEARCYDAVLQRLTATYRDQNAGAAVYTYAWVDQTTWVTSSSYAIQRDVERITHINAYGFQLALKPVVCEEATTLDLEMINTNLIGFQDNGAPRTTRTEVSTQVMVSNKGQKFVIGGLDKKQVVRSVSKVPWLGSIPFLGWIFSSESEVVKKSEIVAVIECQPLMPDTKLSAEVQKNIDEAKSSIDKYGTKAGFIDQNDYGFNQFLLDKEKTSLDPLP